MRRLIRTLGLIPVVMFGAAAPLRAQPAPAIEIVPLTPNASEINSLSLTLDGAYLISNGQIGSARDGRPRVWHLATGRLLRVIGGHDDDTAPASALTALPNGQALAVSDTTIETWDIMSGKRTASFAGPFTEIRSGAVSRDGKLLVVGGSQRVAIVEIAAAKVVRTFAAHKGEIESLALSPDGKLILTLGDSLVRVWRADSGQLSRTVKVAAETGEVKFAGNGRFLTADNSAKGLKLWDVRTGRLLRSFDDREVYRLEVTPDGRKVITASVGRELRVWDLATGTSKLIGREYQHPREHFIVFPDGRRLAQGSIENEILILDLESGKELRKITPPSMVPTAFTVTPDGEHLVWASEDKRIGLWDLHTAQPVRRLADAPNGIAAMAFLPGGRQLLGGGGRIPLWFGTWRAVRSCARSVDRKAT